MPVLGQLLRNAPVWVNTLLQMAIAAAVGGLLFVFCMSLIRRVLRRLGHDMGDAVAQRLTQPLAIAFPVFAIAAVRLEPRLAESESVPLSGLDHLVLLAVIASLTHVAMAATKALVTFSKRRNPIDSQPGVDTREAKRIHTQATIVGRTVQVVLVFLGVGSALLTFPRVQQFGASILASAGIAGIAIGIAARPLLENLIAGIQIGFTQPIRLNDVVFIEGERGQVEEITLTYIVVRIWDDRRLVLPFSKFINESFQNWSRATTLITGTVFLHVDYTADVEAIRTKAREIAESLPTWDRRAFAVHVTDAQERTLQLRVMLSAPDSSSNWDNRTAMLERLVGWLQKEMPDALPRTRFQKMDADSASANEPGSST